jgi:signal transduction histidine kinase
VRLADFIESNADPILVEWVAFARTCGPAQGMDLEALRDHAAAMLKSIVADLRTPQSDAEQTAKSKGDAPAPAGAGDTPAEVHGAGRALSGFSVDEMVSEYRALRASVIRLWTKACGSLTGDDLEDLMRFNEAIDQALAESLTRYSADLDQSREMFIAILGHDLRTPLGVVTMATEFILETATLDEAQRMLLGRVLRSARRMRGMVADLLDFTRIRLGNGIPVVREATDLGTVAREALDESAAVHPKSDLRFATSGALAGKWDAPRISQVLANLLGNAVEHGAAGAPVTLTVTGRVDDVVLRVHNSGPAIAPSEIHGIFSPLKRLRPGAPATGNSTNLGLGLYIAERIVTAHDGTIEVASTAAAGTTFTVRLPR